MTTVCPRASRIAILAALTLISLQAQSSGSVQGVVKDPSGGPVPGATLTLPHASTRQTAQTTSTAAGSYAFLFLPPGQYSLAADRAGFARFVRDPIIVDVAGVAT